MASMSGRPVRCEGVGLVIGDDSSSESEDENEDEETGELEWEPIGMEYRPTCILLSHSDDVISFLETIFSTESFVPRYHYYLSEVPQLGA